MAPPEGNFWKKKAYAQKAIIGLIAYVRLGALRLCLQLCAAGAFSAPMLAGLLLPST
jgi:hypothetical protein